MAATSLRGGSHQGPYLITSLALKDTDGASLVVAAGGCIRNLEGAAWRFIRTRSGGWASYKIETIEVYFRGGPDQQPYVVVPSSESGKAEGKPLIVVMEPTDPLRRDAQWVVSSNPITYGTFYKDGIHTA